MPPNPRRSEPARDGRQDTAGIQIARVIVDIHREQARSYGDWVASVVGEALCQ